MSRSRSNFKTFREYYHELSLGDEYYMITDLISSYLDVMEREGELFNNVEKALERFPDYSKVSSTSMAELNKYIEEVDAAWKDCKLNDAQRGLISLQDAAKVAIDCIDSRYGSFQGWSKADWCDSRVKAKGFLDSLKLVYESFKDAKQRCSILEAQQRTAEKQQSLIDGSFFLSNNKFNEAKPEEAASLGFKK